MELRQLKLRRRCPKQCGNFRCRRNASNGVTRIDLRLQLPDPIPACANCQPGIVLQMLFEAPLVERLVIERGKIRRFSTKHPDQSELPRDAVAGETKTDFLREFKSAFSLSLDFIEQIASRKTICCQVNTAIAGIGKVPGFLCRLEGAPQERARRYQRL